MALVGAVYAGMSYDEHRRFCTNNWLLLAFGAATIFICLLFRVPEGLMYIAVFLVVVILFNSPAEMSLRLQKRYDERLDQYLRWTVPGESRFVGLANRQIENKLIKAHVKGAFGWTGTPSGDIRQDIKTLLHKIQEATTLNNADLTRIVAEYAVTLHCVIYCEDLTKKGILYFGADAASANAWVPPCPIPLDENGTDSIWSMVYWDAESNAFKWTKRYNALPATDELKGRYKWMLRVEAPVNIPLLLKNE
jgi:hypothetical protein